MKLSVIIVSYKVPYFLEQTLLAVRKAADGIATEVIVVDNKSEDGTVEMLQEKFPEVILIANKDNTGFAKANNQGIAIAQGEYILFLNPDTVVREDTFEQTIGFMEAHPEAGGLGVKMIDGKGHFLPESKRGFPSPEVAFYKTFGLSKLFPKSKRFNKYHLGYLDKDEIHQVDVLSGAFMLMPRKVLEEIGYWDEAFFMYGEDIDLSYRIIKAGYKNYYYPETTIIHYKGESTKKGSLNYVKTFYEAMIIFAKKHFKGSKAGLFVLMLQLAIYFRAFLTLFSNIAKQLSLPIIDAMVIYGGMIVIKDTWEMIRFHEPSYYDVDLRLVFFNFPLYILVWVFVTYLRGGYDAAARTRHLMTGVGIGTVLVAAIYAFLPEELHFSRMLILLSSLWAFAAMYATRSIKSYWTKGTIFWSKHPPANLVIVGKEAESQRVLNLLYQAHISINYIGRVSSEMEQASGELLGNVHQLAELCHIYDVNEIIFCGSDISSKEIIDWMTRLGRAINYKIVPSQSEYIIGSNSKNSAGDLYTIDINFNITNSIKRRNKRIMDIVYSLVFILTFVLIFPFIKDRWGAIKNSLAVLLGRKTWVGYYPLSLSQHLPTLKPAVLTPLDRLELLPTERQTIHRINLFYAKDYSSTIDFNIIQKAWQKIGRQSMPELPISADSTKVNV